MSLLDTLIDLDKIAARELLGERRGRTVSRVFGSQIARNTGVDVQRGTDIFHAGLLIVGVLGLGGLAAAANRR
jgi:hypothetical protein